MLELKNLQKMEVCKTQKWRGLEEGVKRKSDAIQDVTIK
jgi:hypothetical protein